MRPCQSGSVNSGNILAARKALDSENDLASVSSSSTSRGLVSEGPAWAVHLLAFGFPPLARPPRGFTTSFVDLSTAAAAGVLPRAFIRGFWPDFMTFGFPLTLVDVAWVDFLAFTAAIRVLLRGWPAFCNVIAVHGGVS